VAARAEPRSLCPVAGAGSAAMPLWDFQGSTMVTSQYVRLTPDEGSREGSIWNRVVRWRRGAAGPGAAPAPLPALGLRPLGRLSAQPCFLKDWELHVHFKIHGAGKKNLHGDGLALWYTQERLVPGTGCSWGLPGRGLLSARRQPGSCPWPGRVLAREGV